MSYAWAIWKWLQEQVIAELRGARMMQWLWVLLRPLRDLVAEFTAYRTATRHDASLNGQVIVLERGVNRFTGAIQPNGSAGNTVYISIEDPQDNRQYAYCRPAGASSGWSYSYRVSETPPQDWFYSLLESEAGENVDFVASYIGPANFNTTAVTAWINKYKPAGKRWKYEDSGII